MPNSNIETLLMIFVGIAAVGLLLQGSILLALFLTVRKAVTTGKAEADEFRAKLVPVLESSKELIDTGKDLVKIAKSVISDLEPQLKSAATQLADMAHDIHQQANRLEASVDEVAVKARNQVDRVDRMTTGVLNGLDRFGSFVNEAVNLPVRQFSGIVAATRAVMGTLRSPAPSRTHRAPQPGPVHEENELRINTGSMTRK